MAHEPIEFLVDPISGSRSIVGNNLSGGGRVTVRQTDIDYTATEDGIQRGDDGHGDEPRDPTIVFLFTDNTQIRVKATEAEIIQIRGFFDGFPVSVDANGRVIPSETDGDGADAGGDTTPELQLVQDPVIYNRPETGLSQRNVPFFKFHNPNGKSAITISMTDVDHTRFDSNSDDTHHYVVVTKARIEIRCLCTVNEQLGLEFRFRGTTHVISAEESNNVRLITESRDNPQ